MNLAETITKFSIEVLQMEETKNSPEMVRVITELLKINHISDALSIDDISKKIAQSIIR